MVVCGRSARVDAVPPGSDPVIFGARLPIVPHLPPDEAAPIERGAWEGMVVHESPVVAITAGNMDAADKIVAMFPSLTRPPSENEVALAIACQRLNRYHGYA